MTIKHSRSNSVALIGDPDTGEVIRKDTGEVIFDSALSQEKEWRSFGSEEDSNKSRTGAPSSLAFHDMGPRCSVKRGPMHPVIELVPQLK